MDKDIKLLIFDFDGTLADTLPHLINCVQKCIDKYNLRQFTKEDVHEYNGGVLGNILKEFGAKEEQVPEIEKYFASIFLDNIADICLYDNVSQTLKDLKQKGYTLAVATNRGRETIIPLLKSLGIISEFEIIISESDVENKKPNPDMINLILNKLNYSENETLVLGDTKFDILMSQNANCKSCYVCYDTKLDNDIVKLNPDFTIHNFKELNNIL